MKTFSHFYSRVLNNSAQSGVTAARASSESLANSGKWSDRPRTNIGLVTECLFCSKKPLVRAVAGVACLLALTLTFSELRQAETRSGTQGGRAASGPRPRSPDTEMNVVIFDKHPEFCSGYFVF